VNHKVKYKIRLKIRKEDFPPNFKIKNNIFSKKVGIFAHFQAKKLKRPFSSLQLYNLNYD